MWAIVIFADVLSLMPGLNMVVDVVMGLLFAVVGSGKTNIYTNDIGLTLGMLLLEATPGVSALPTFSLRWWWAKRQAKLRGES